MHSPARKYSFFHDRLYVPVIYELSTAGKPGKQTAALEFIFQTSVDVIDVAGFGENEYSPRRRNEFLDTVWDFPREKNERRVLQTAGKFY